MSASERSSARPKRMTLLRVAARMADPLEDHTVPLPAPLLLLFGHDNQQFLHLCAGPPVMATPDKIIHSVKSAVGRHKLQGQGIPRIQSKPSRVFPKHSCRASNKVYLCPSEERRNKFTRTDIFVPECKDDGFARNQRKDLSVRLLSLENGMPSLPNDDLDIDSGRLGGQMRIVPATAPTTLAANSIANLVIGFISAFPVLGHPCLGFTINISPCRTS